MCLAFLCGINDKERGVKAKEKGIFSGLFEYGVQ
jgi:hypothetical protein